MGVLSSAGGCGGKRRDTVFSRLHGADVLCRNHGPRKKTPDTVYIICAAIPLIPGGSLYNTMHYAAEGKWEEFSETGLHTLLLAAAIAVGILCMMTILHVIVVFLKNARDVSRTCTEKADRGFRKADRTFRSICRGRGMRKVAENCGGTEKDGRNADSKDVTGEIQK